MALVPAGVVALPTDMAGRLVQLEADRCRDEGAAHQLCQSKITEARRRCHDEIQIIRAKATIARREILNQGGAGPSNT